MRKSLCCVMIAYSRGRVDSVVKPDWLNNAIRNNESEMLNVSRNQLIG